MRVTNHGGQLNKQTGGIGVTPGFGLAANSPLRRGCPKCLAKTPRPCKNVHGETLPKVHNERRKKRS